MKLYFCGYNGFKQFENCDELMLADVTAWTSVNLPKPQKCATSLKFCSSWSVNVIGISKSLLLTGCLKGAPGQSKILTFANEIKAISCNDLFCLILLDDGRCYKFLFDSAELSELKFIGVGEEDGSADKKSTTCVIEHITCGQTFSVAVTNTNVVYNIPSRIHEFPKHVKVKKVICGAEHALLLTSNGDVFSWGSSSRGQLGLGELNNEQAPTLIDALAGVKITDISAGLWHSAAVSAFGDLYVWGWNLNGQLGKPIYKNVKVNFENGRTDVVRHKDVSVFASPEVVDLPAQSIDNEENECLETQFDVEQVHCGGRHTIIQTKCGKVLGCGFNRFGQLGLSEKHNDDGNVVRFYEIGHSITDVFQVKCGSWCTIFFAECHQ
ncbi:RCC1 domain-containing protein 1 [Pseudolycoriella hygida]|uniref:RCC1 domain-containing protein 1 n=1 Tax=Pseudolycoriella hygida TaxID=35572 RepID=A0A9Q0MVX9_9DIPT|nr:RCC1 domain-containing protein 1 [Pseudolycoriella hygida]